MIFLCITSALLQLAVSVARELLIHYLSLLQLAVYMAREESKLLVYCSAHALLMLYLSLLQLAVYMAREESVLLVARIVELHIRRARLQVVK